MKRDRKILLGVTAFLLMAVVVGGLVVKLSSRFSTTELQIGLLASVAAVEKAPCARPAHVDETIPGTFGDALAPHLDALQTAKAAVDRLPLGERNRLRGFVKREGDVNLEPAILSLLDTARPAVRGALAASRAAEGCPPSGLRTIADPADPLSADGMLRFLTAAKLAAADIRLLTAAGKPDEALALCVDGLAFARDLSWGPGLLGAGLSVNAIRLLHSACVESIDLASGPARLAASASIGRMREGFRPLEVTLREDYVSLELRVFGSMLDHERAARLSPAARAMIVPGASVSAQTPMNLTSFGIGDGGMKRMAWHDVVGMRQWLLFHVSKPGNDRDRRIDELVRRAQASPNPLTRIAFGDPRAQIADWEFALAEVDKLARKAGKELQ